LPKRIFSINESAGFKGTKVDPGSLFMKALLTSFTLCFLMIVLYSCQDGKSTRPDLNNMAAYTLNDIAYGVDSQQRMDVYLPAGRSRNATPAMILIHGGGWTGGNKADFAGYIEAFRKRMPHYAFVNINYRLVNGDILLPAQEEDVRLSIDFLRKQAEIYDINTNQLVLLGASAGAHLALLHAYKHPDPGIRAVVDFFGPTDLVRMHEQPWHPLVPLALQMIIGARYQSAPAAYRNASPVTFVTAKSPATLIFHGGRDNVVEPSQSRLLADSLTAAGVPHRLLIYPAERHGWYGKNLNKSFDTLQAFLEQHVQ